jgi:tetratricopeptide (TPR) repeat protein
LTVSDSSAWGWSVPRTNVWLALQACDTLTRMGLEPDARLVVNRHLDLRELPLTPTDFFLFSRVEALSATAPPRVADVLATSGQSASSAEQVLAKLVELGALVVEVRNSERASAPSSAPRTAQGEAAQRPDPRQRARDRKKELLAAQMRAVRSSDAKPTSSPDEPALPAARVDQPSTEVQTHRSILDTIEPAPEDDARLDSTLAVPIDRQRRLLVLRDRLRHIGHFELLGLEPVDDVRVVRRAYHAVSRDFHPDSYFGKNIGHFHGLFDDLFRRARLSYEFLLDAGRRKALVDAFEAQVHEERERQGRADTQQRAAAQQQRDQQAQQAQRARAERERERLRTRASAHKREQAATHAKQARHERDIGRFGTAATLFRLAHEHDPSQPEYEQGWRECLATARQQRAETAFGRGQEALHAGHTHEAARRFAEAAEADPSLRNLAEAAASMSEVDPAQAHSFAMAALEALLQAQAEDPTQVEARTASYVHQACARAFLAAGQLATAREQAERAHRLLPSNQTRALLNSIKLA